MSSSSFYTEQLLDEARSHGTADDIWMSVVYEDTPVTYIRLDQEEMEFFREETGSETYHEFLIELDRQRDHLPERILNLDSYDIVDHALEVNPVVLREWAGPDFERYIDQEIMRKFDKKDRSEDDFTDDFLFEGMEPLIRNVVGGRTQEFKQSMYRKPLLQKSLVFYEDSLGALYNSINLLQQEHYQEG